jgi:hypothetical protein
MTIQRINGCPVRLDKLTDSELFRLGEYVRRNLDQAEAELERVNEEMVRRELFHEPVA